MTLDTKYLGSLMAPNAAQELATLARTNPMHYTADGISGLLDDGSESSDNSFQTAMLKAMDGVSASQAKSDGLIQQMIVDPESVDAQDVTIAMAEANMSLNLAKTILSRIVTAWKDVINTR